MRLERVLEIGDELQVDVLVDRDARGRVRDVDEHGRALRARDGVTHLAADVHDVAPPRGAHPDLVHDA